MDSGAVSVATPLDAKTLLARINARLTSLRRWLGHDHGDAAFWAPLSTTAPAAQRERQTLRWLANLLHVERATNRGRLHGTWFVALEVQRAWLVSMEQVRWGAASRYLSDVSEGATLTMLRAGSL